MSAPKPIIWPAGTFVCVGDNVVPYLVILTKGQHDAYRTMRELYERRGEWKDAKVRNELFASVFERGVEEALAATHIGLMTAVALNYVGPHQVALRGMCAAIAAGRSVCKDQSKGSGTDPNEAAPLKPVKPKKPSPSGKVRPMNELFAEEEARLIEGAQL